MFREITALGYQLLIIFLFFVFLIFLCDFSFASKISLEGIQIYQKNIHLFPEHKQKLADDIVRYQTADNLWDVLRDEFSLNHYEERFEVQERIQWFLNNQDFLLRSASRAAPYLYYILQQVKKRHLPAELVLLPIIESGYNPFSLSNMGAAGIWQLMPDTATGYGVKRDGWYDGRRDIITSTRAALDYLFYLQSFFEGNWLWAMAAYNTGEGNVLSAIKRNIRNGQETDFWSLPVAQQTKDYVPSILALAVIISHPERYPIYLPPVRNAPYLAQVDVGSQINLRYAASLAGISHKMLLQLNPGFIKPSTSTMGPYKLVVPIENVEQFSENLSKSTVAQRIPNWSHYKVKSGDTFDSVANQFATTPDSIRKLNHLAKNKLAQGTNLLIPTQQQTPSASYDAQKQKTLAALAPQEVIFLSAKKENSQNNKLAMITANDLPRGKYILQPGDTIYMVRKKDTLASIAKSFNVSQVALQKTNQLNTQKLSTGKQLIIPTHLKYKNKNNLTAGDTLYMVRRGDTIEKIAKKFNMSSSSIRLANLLTKQHVQEGERLIIPTHTQS